MGLNFDFLKTKSEVAFSGWTENRLSIPQIEKLSDEQLAELNNILDWKCFVVDSQGRRFGKPALSNKRAHPQSIPDRRLALLQNRIPLKDKHVLEVGCFEGIHTIGLCQVAKRVTAIDSRLENVAKATVRTKFFGVNPQIFIYDLEQINRENCSVLKCDVLHHIGVLYHLADPISQLMAFRDYVGEAVFLDTHYATPEMATQSYETSYGTFSYYFFREGKYKDVFAGMKDHAKWLKLEDIVSTLKVAGFSNVEIIETRSERNGHRVLLLAKKESL